MLGLKRGTVKLTSAQDEWARLFDEEKKFLLDTFGDRILSIEHIGSTAIPEVPAKPIIDMNVAVSSLEDNHIEQFVAPLQKLGYTYLREHPFKDRHFFAKGPDEKRTHHLNLVELNSETGWRIHILFRDYLRRHKSAREEYTALKTKLAQKFANNREEYTKGKEDFIRKTIDLAKAEQNQ